MRPPNFETSFTERRAFDRDRMVSMALVVLLHLLLLLLLLRLAPPFRQVDKAAGPLTVDLIAEPSAEQDSSRAAQAPSPRREAVQEAEQPEAKPDTTVAPPVVPQSSIWSEVVPITREELARTDQVIRSSPPRPPGTGTEGESRTASRGGTDNSAGPGTGPNGETLYNARWEREPTDAELATYLAGARRRDGWGIIACRTVPGNRVEDCFEISQSPASGLAGAIRRAAWQFRILPPRIGGRPIVGEWVRIRIDYSVREASGSSSVTP